MQILPFKKKDSDSDKKSLECSNQVKEDLDRYRKNFEANWKPERRLYYGDIWKGNEYKPYENNAFKIIEGQTAILTDSMSSPVIRVKDEAFKDQARNLGEAVKWVFKDQSLDMKRTCAIRNGLIDAPGYLFKWYDHNAANGDGADVIELLDGCQVWLDGAVKDITKSRKAIIEVDRDKSWLMLTYPDKAKEIEKEKGGKSKGKDNGARETRDVGGKHKNRMPEKYEDSDLLTLRYCYKQDHSLEKIPQEDSEGEVAEENKALEDGDSPDVNMWQDHEFHMSVHGADLIALYAMLDLEPAARFEAAQAAVESLMEQNPEGGFEEILIKIKLLEDHIEAHSILQRENKSGKRLKFRGGWRVIETVNDIVVYDGPHKHDHLMIPVAPYYGNKDDTIYGFSEIKNMYDSEKMGAVMLYKEYKGLQKVANPSLLLSIDSGLTKDDVSNEDGGVYEVDDVNTSMRYMVPGQISNQVVAFQEKRQLASNDITGMNDASQGKIPHPNASGQAITKLQQQSIGRLRLKERLYESHSDRILGQLTASDIIQFWVNEKTLKLEDSGAESTEVIFNPVDMIDLKYEFEMSSGSMAGVDKDAFNTLVDTWVQKQYITPAQGFELAEMPKKEKMLAFMSENQNQEAEMQAVLEEQTGELQTALEQTTLQAQELRKENLKIRANLVPETMTPDEQKELEQIIQNELLLEAQGENLEEQDETI